MENLKLGEKERYDIEPEIIKKYNIKAGDVSPFTRLRVIDIEIEDDDIDIKKPSIDDGIDIKRVSSSNDESDIDIKKPGPVDDIDIKKVKK